MLIQILVFGGGMVFGAKVKRHRNRQRLLKPVNRAQLAKPKQAGLYEKGKAALKAVKKLIRISSTGGELRHQQARQIAASATESTLDATDRKLDKNIKRSISLMGLALAGSWFYAPLLPIAGAGTLYILGPVFKQLFHHLRAKRITTELVEVVSVLSLLASGYFFIATFITFTSLLCMKLLTRTEQRSQQKLVNIFNQDQRSVWLMNEGAEVEIPLEAVQQGDIIVVNAGEIIPVDGIIAEGWASVDQHKLTGEAKPLEVETGARVLAPSLVLAGRILVKTEKTGSHTSAAKIGEILEQTREYKESQRLRGKQIADKFTGPTLAASGLTLPLLGPGAAMAVIWTAFGFNMKLYGPISVLNFLHIMATNGILIKDGRSLEMLQKVDTLVFDKTGTLTMQQPQLTRIHVLEPFDETTLLSWAAAAEYRQSHPIAKAIRDAAQQRQLELPITAKAACQLGYGIEVTIDARRVQVGSARYMQELGVHCPDDIKVLKTQADASGYSLVYVAVDGVLAGVLELQPGIRPEARAVINDLKARGVSVCILSGDQEQPTRQLANELGVEDYFAETLPDEKAEVISALRASGKFVAYVGDGINDAIALKQANVSISLRGASTVATDTAQIILMDGDLKRLKSLFEISRSFEANMRNSYLASMVPGAITLAGVLFFQMGLFGSLVVYYSAKMVGLTNVMRPLLESEKRQSRPKGEQGCSILKSQQ